MGQREYTRQEVIDLEYQGRGIVKPEGRTVFVDGVLPREVIDLRITRRKRDHAFGSPMRWHVRSPQRVEPFCSHFSDCGGCAWQYLPYPAQAAYKERFVREIMQRIGGIEEPVPLPIIACENDTYYRNKLEYSFAPKRWIPQEEVESKVAIEDRRAFGFHVRGRFDRVLNVEKCYLQPDPSNSIRDAARDVALSGDYTFHDPVAHSGLLRSLIIRTTRDGETMVVLVIGEEQPEMAVRFLSALCEKAGSITSAHYIINTTRNDDIGPHAAFHVFGSPTITERCGHLSLVIHPKSFYQTNSAQAESLYGVVREWADCSGKEALLDCYCGIGSIALFLADMCRTVAGVEVVDEAVECARENATKNRIGHARFHTGDVRTLLRSAGGVTTSPHAIPRPDIIVLDPPRSGVHPDVLLELMRIAPRQIIYVSCKPATQARDLTRLCERYSITRIQPVDMFPHTFHIENVVDLRLRKSNDA
jgi:23S rRNA (uracil1939-C5)-methyltransferase